MRAFDDLGRAVVAPNPLDELVVRLTRALGDEDVAGASQISRRLAQRSSRQQILVSEWCLSIDQHDVEPVFQMEILQTVVEEQRVGLQFFDGEEPAFHPVLVHEHDHVLQIIRQHVRLVAGGQRIEQKGLAVGDDCAVAGSLPPETLPPFADTGRRGTLL